MSELDKALRKVSVGVYYPGQGTFGEPLDDEAIEQIKRAFVDAGYVQYDPRMQFDKYGNLKINGEEWYRRFEKELNAPKTAIFFNMSHILNAAKRAAGIEGSTLHPLT